MAVRILIEAYGDWPEGTRLTCVPAEARDGAVLVSRQRFEALDGAKRLRPLRQAKKSKRGGRRGEASP